MAHPRSVPRAPARVNGTLRSAGDLDRLAAAFRPAWELDDAPFTGAGTLSASDLQALQSSGPNAEVRAVQALSEPHAPPKATATPEPIASIIVEATPAAPAPAPPQALALAETPAATPASRPPPAPAPWASPPSHPSRPPPPASRAPTGTPMGPPARGRTPSLDFESSASFTRPSKKPLWIGAGVMAVALAFGVRAVFAVQDKPAAPLETTAKPVENAKVYAIPPPPPETAAPPAAAAPAPSPVVTAAVAAQSTAPPVSAPVPPVAHASTATQPAARSAYTPPRPARKAASIVRDVPF